MRILAAIFLIGLSLLSPNLPASAQDDLSNLKPLPANALDEGAPITMGPGGPSVIKLSQDAASIIVGNPAHATAVLENPRLIVLMPQQPGATQVMALDRGGKMILNRQVLVGGGSNKGIRINRACRVGRTAECQPVAMYYCPDRCYETSLPSPEEMGVSGDNAVAPIDNGAPMPAAPAPEETPDTLGETPQPIDE